MFQAQSLILSALPTNLHGKETHPRFFSSLMALLSLLNLVLLASAQVRPLIVSPPEPPPWIFAAPTGATKVTVYWDPSPSSYTTGYVVLWGTRQGGPYPNSSPELPSTQRQYTVQGLQQDQTYSFVVKAVFRGTGVVYSDPSPEDSAVPHSGAVRWDSGNPAWILEDIRRIIESGFGSSLDVLGPDGQIYSDTGAGEATSFFNQSKYAIELINFPGIQTPLTNTQPQVLQNTLTGPYRRVQSSQTIYGVRGTFWVPSTFSPHFPYFQISITPDSENVIQTRDTPCIYFGVAFQQTDIEGGVFYHTEDRYRVNYPRWQACLSVREPGNKKPIFPAIHDILNRNAHILDNIYGGTETQIELLAYPTTRLVALRVIPTDPGSGEELFRRELTACAKFKQNFQGATWRRVHSIAQRKTVVERDYALQGYAPTGSFVLQVGVGYNPIEGSFLNPIKVSTTSLHLLWQEWTPAFTNLNATGAFPASGVVFWTEIDRYFRELVSIQLPD